MTPRSWLFVPGDSDRKLGKADGSGADALILDLEDAVAPDAKPAARRKVVEFLAARPRGGRAAELWVRVNPLADALLLGDLAAVMPGAPDGIVLPKPDGPDDVRRLSHYLDAFETQHGIDAGSTRILPVASETAAAPFRLGDYAGAGLARLAGLTWGAEDLATALGASTNRDEDGTGFAFTFRVVRSAVLMAAHAAGVPAIDTLQADFRDTEALERSSAAAWREGFAGRLAIHPAQVAPINRSFRPSDAEVAFATRVVAAFDAAPGVGAVSLDGRMVDIPHLKQARHVFADAVARDG